MSLFKEGQSFIDRRTVPVASVDAYADKPSLRSEHFSQPTLTVTLIAFASVEFLFLSIVLLLTAQGFLNLDEAPPQYSNVYAWIAIAVAALEIIFSATLDNFRHLQSLSTRRFFSSGIVSIAAAFLIVTSVLHLFAHSFRYPPDLLAMQFVAACGAMLAVRVVVGRHFERVTSRGLVHGRRVVLVGRQQNFPGHIERIKSSRGTVQILCCPIPPANAAPTSYISAKTLATALVAECRSLHPDDVVLLADETRTDELKQISSMFLDIPAALYAIPTRHLHLWTKANLAEVSGMPALGVSVPRLSGANRALKRVFDISMASLALVLLSPLLLMTGIAIVLDSRGPVFFRQIRHGYNNQPISILKFRTMYASCDLAFRQASKGDERITRIGRILRLSGIDEIPQLLNVLRGEMSMVGPRPHAVPHNEMFFSRIDHFSRRHNVLPGLTGWAQVNGYRGETDTLEKMSNRIECDLYYVDNWSLFLDLKIVLLTMFSKKTYTNAG